MRTVTVEEHFPSPRFLDGPGRELRAQASKFGAAAAKLLERLCDVGGQRIAEMDDAGIDMQVLSLTSPGTEQLEPADAIIVAREANQFLEAESMQIRSRDLRTHCCDRAVTVIVICCRFGEINCSEDWTTLWRPEDRQIVRCASCP